MLTGSFFAVTEAKSWADARQHCINAGSRLIEMKSQEEFDRTVQISDEIGEFWLGGSDIQQEGVWVWNSNNEQINMNQFWYRASEPDGGTDQNCLMFFNHNSVAGSLSSVCGNAKKFACEIN